MVAAAVLALLPSPFARAADIRFSDFTQASGIDLTLTCGGTPSREIIEVDGGGVAFIDFDNDGDWDIFFANGARMADPEHGPGSKLYENRGDGTFRDVTQSIGITLTRWATGVAVGDIDGDRFDDLFITCYGRNVMLKNDRGKRFVDVTRETGLGDTRWATSAAFGDIDNDGDLDLYTVNYLVFDANHPPSRQGKEYKGVNVMAGPHGLVAQADILYENTGGRFRDITEDSGCGSVRAGYGLVTTMIDFDDDGRLDIFVGNDSAENFLFHNLGGNRFENVGPFAGVSGNMDGSNQATMGIALADVDRNGRVDFFTTNFSSDTNTLHLNLDGVFFDDRTSQFGLGLVSREFLSWGCGFYDFDSDGDEDLFISNGHVYPQAKTHDIDSDYEQPPVLFERKGPRFERLTYQGSPFETPLKGRAVAFGDIDNDGDVDIVHTTLNDRVRIWRNESPRACVAVVELKQDSHNHRAYGSMVELSVGGKTYRRWITGGGSFQSANAPVAYFGLGDIKDTEAVLNITWPDGAKTTVKNVPLNKRLTVTPKSFQATDLDR